MNSQSFRNIYYQPGENPVFSFRSGLAVREETLLNGVLVSSGHNAAGYPLDVLSGFPSRLNHGDFAEPSAFNIEIDGQSIDHRLEFVDFSIEESEKSTESILTLRSGIKPVTLRIHTVVDGTQMLTRYIEIINTSEKPLCLSRLSLLSGGLEAFDRRPLANGKKTDEIYSVGYFTNDQWGREGEFAWRKLMPDTLCVDTRFGRDRFRHPFIFIRNNITGVIYSCQTGWSGGCRFSVDYNATEERSFTSLAFKAEITSHKPITVIGAGEVFVTPEVHFGIICGGLDDAVNDMHAHIRKSVLCMPEADPTACLVGAGMGAEHTMSVEDSKDFMRQFASLGAEVFIIDAGWECPPEKQTQWGDFNGLNIPDPDRYPNGLGELSDYCRSLGMKFGLWVDIETVGRFSETNKCKPDWRGSDIFGNRSGNYLDMSNPEAARWAEDELARIITEYKLDLLRVDHNVSFRDYFAIRDTGSGIPECVSVKHINAVYKMYENLKKRFPDVIFENCAGGGARTDLGMMKSFNHTWVSDCQKAPHSVMITNGMTLALPPERVDRLFAGMGCHEQGSLDLHMRNTMLTHMTLNVIAPVGAQLNPVQADFVRHSVDVYKNFIRSFLPEAKIYHHTPESACRPEKGCILEIASPDGRKGAIGVFALSDEKKDFIIIPEGINAGMNYRITLDNSGAAFDVSGYELMTNGLKITVPSSLSSELILFEAN
ncbi:MAG: alpha-galactosidase [Clostridia bacterium]|nr:alpha-galactosidase [Clostridia bacterium]